MAEFEKTIRQWARMCEVTRRENEAAGYSNCSRCKLSDICCGLTPIKILEIATVEEVVMAWAAEHPEPVYPTWMEWLTDVGAIPKVISWDESLVEAVYDAVQEHIPANIAEKLEIKPKEG